MALDLPQGTWDVFSPSWRVLTGKAGGETCRQLCEEIWNHWEDVCSNPVWHKVGEQNLWVTSDDDKRWFLYNLLIAGGLDIYVSTSMTGNWNRWHWSSQKRSFEILESKYLPQDNVRIHTPCGYNRIRNLEAEVTEIKPF